MATFYINADSGNDTTGSGASGSPWLTLSKAVTASSSGDTIYCQAATAVYTFGNQAISGRTITAPSTGGAVFDAATTAKYWTLSGTINVSNLTFQNIASNGTNVFIVGADSSVIVFDNCKFKTLTFVTSDSMLGSGSCSSWSFTIKNSYFYNCYCAGVSSNSLIGPRSGTLWNVYLYNLVFHWPSTISTGFNMFDNYAATSANIYMKNCIFQKDTSSAVSWGGNLATITATYNDFYFSAGSQISGAPTGTTGTITSDPLFVDKDNNIYTLRPTSPCRATGTAV